MLMLLADPTFLILHFQSFKTQQIKDQPAK